MKILENYDLDPLCCAGRYGSEGCEDVLRIQQEVRPLDLSLRLRW